MACLGSGESTRSLRGSDYRCKRENEIDERGASSSTMTSNELKHGIKSEGKNLCPDIHRPNFTNNARTGPSIILLDICPRKSTVAFALQNRGREWLDKVGIDQRQYRTSL
jgi:hypothetical protein